MISTGRVHEKESIPEQRPGSWSTDLPGQPKNLATAPQHTQNDQTPEKRTNYGHHDRLNTITEASLRVGKHFIRFTAWFQTEDLGDC